MFGENETHPKCERKKASKQNATNKIKKWYKK